MNTQRHLAPINGLFEPDSVSGLLGMRKKRRGFSPRAERSETQLRSKPVRANQVRLASAFSGIHRIIYFFADAHGFSQIIFGIFNR
jgi:hypothetical protein